MLTGCSRAICNTHIFLSIEDSHLYIKRRREKTDNSTNDLFFLFYILFGLIKVLFSTGSPVFSLFFPLDSFKLIYSYILSQFLLTHEIKFDLNWLMNVCISVFVCTPCHAIIIIISPMWCAHISSSRSTRRTSYLVV